MQKEWVVLLEAARADGLGLFGATELHGLLQALDPGPWGGCLHSQDRYAVQVTAWGAGPVDALNDVLSRWAQAVRQLDLPSWNLVRLEVFTPEELEAAWNGRHRSEVPFPRAASTTEHGQRGRNDDGDGNEA